MSQTRPCPHAYEFRDIVGPFHRWFAWKPIRTWDGRFVWLRTVWRARTQTKDYLPRSHIQDWTHCVGQPATTPRRDRAGEKKEDV